MDTASFASIQSLFAMIANGQEIVVDTALSTVIFAWVPMASRARGYTSKLCLLCIGSLIVGLGAPRLSSMLLEWAFSTQNSFLIYLATGGNILFALLGLILFLAVAFFPILMATREKLSRKRLIIVLNIFGCFFAFLWLAALVAASFAVGKTTKFDSLVKAIKERHIKSDGK